MPRCTEFGPNSVGNNRDLFHFRPIVECEVGGHQRVQPVSVRLLELPPAGEPALLLPARLDQQKANSKVMIHTYHILILKQQEVLFK
jgi:hypothetical protein